MMPRQSVPLPWLAASGLLLALLAWLWLAPGAPAKWRRWQQPAPQAPALDDAQQAQLHFNPAAGNASAQVLARPLFMSTRRPPAPAGAAASAASAAAVAQSPIDQARVLGMLDGPALAGALIEYEGQPQFVHVGQSLGGWRITALQDRTVHIERRGERRTLELPFLGEQGEPGTVGQSPASSPATGRPGGPAPVPSPLVRVQPAPDSVAVPAAAPDSAPQSADARPAVSGAAFGGGSRPSASR